MHHLREAHARRGLELVHERRVGHTLTLPLQSGDSPEHLRSADPSSLLHRAALKQLSFGRTKNLRELHALVRRRHVAAFPPPNPRVVLQSHAVGQLKLRQSPGQTQEQEALTELALRQCLRPVRPAQ